MKIGILSDTHGVLKDTFLDELQSCDYLLHAGDIGSLKCYETLKDLHVPLYIIKGNCDKGEWTKYLPETLAAPIDVGRFSISSIRKAICLIHNRKQILLLPGIPTIMK
ncbi:MAG: metallophosphoesterase family protein [Roseburia sp.]